MSAALVAAQRLRAGQRCVVLLPDSTRNYMSKFLEDEWMVAQGFERPSILTKSARLGSARGGAADEPEWWEARSVVELELPTPITVPPTMACSDAIEVLNAHGIDQIPVVDEAHGVVGVVTLGNLTSKILSRVVAAAEPVSAAMFRQFRQVPLATSLGSLFRIFQRDAFCLVVASQRMLTSATRAVEEKKVVVGVCTQVDLLRFVVEGPAGHPTAPQAPAARSSSQAAAKRAYRNEPVVPDRTSLDCASLAWSFVKQKTPLSSPLSSPTAPSTAARQPPPLSLSNKPMEPDRTNLDCASLAWSFVKHKTPLSSPLSSPTAPSTAAGQPPPLSLSDNPTDTGDQTGRKGDHYVDAPCASLAWSFVKHKTALSPSGSLNASVQASPATHATGGDAPPPILVKTA